jgi:23S rRNA G2445 N2-methylase RlmL
MNHALMPTAPGGCCRFADIRPYEVVVDACCGVATIPIEGALAHPQAVFIGGEVGPWHLVEGP